MPPDASKGKDPLVASATTTAAPTGGKAVPLDPSLPASKTLDQPGVGGTPNDPRRAILLMLLAMFLFGTMDALIKLLTADFPTMQVVFFRNAFAFLPISWLIWRMGGIRRAIVIHNWRSHIVRCTIGVIGQVLFFYSFANMPLADVVAIAFAAPLFITALSVFLLKEKVGMRRWIACSVGFVGVLVILQPGPGLLQSFVLLALLATLLYSLGVILVRRISRTENTVSIVFFFTASVTLVSGAFLPFQWVTPSWEAFGLLAALGIIGGLGQLSMTSAFKAAEPSLIVPFEYTTMFWAALYGWWIWGDIPGLNIWIGFVIVSASGIYIALREGDLGLRRGIAKRLYVRR